MKRTTMMRKLSFVTLAVTSFIAAGAVAAPGINSKYNIRGDRAIAPIQVFDDGQRMFLQLRRTDIPPVPIDSENGRPLSYIIDGPYMVIPMLPAAVVLRYGQREATILSTTREIRPLPAAGLSPVPSGGGLYFGAAPTAKETPPAADPIPAAAPQAKVTPLSARAPVVSGSIETKVPVAPASTPAPASVRPSVVAAASAEKPVAPLQEKRPIPDSTKGSFEVTSPAAPATVPAAKKEVPQQAVRGSFGVAGSASFEALRVTFAGDAVRLSAAEVVKLSEFLQQHPGKSLTVEAPASATGEKRAAEVRRQLKRLGAPDHQVSVEIGSTNLIQVLAEKG